MKRLCFIAAMTVLSSSMTQAVELPKASPSDARIKTVRYNSRDVIRLKTHALISTFVRFAEYEQVENIAVGDSDAWLVVENANKNGIFIKPKEDNIFTNLVVTTTQRVYTFELTAAKAESASSDDLNFLVSFEYPDDEVARLKEQQRKASVQVSPQPVGPEAWNFRYEFSGSRVIKPTQVLDDGKFTYFDFGEHRKLPALFVVERIEHQFTLRDGKEVTCIFNLALGALPKALSKARREPL
jgi:type IV secretion system protein VirB9